MLILASVQIVLRLGPDPDRGPPIDYHRSILFVVAVLTVERGAPFPRVGVVSATSADMHQAI